MGKYFLLSYLAAVLNEYLRPGRSPHPGPSLVCLPRGSPGAAMATSPYSRSLS